MEQNRSYTVQFLLNALNDMTEIISSFVMLGSKQGAKRIQNKFNKAFNQIQIFPFSGITIPDKRLGKIAFRMVVVEKYLMFYKVFEEENQIIIYRILNGKRNYPSLLHSLYN